MNTCKVCDGKLGPSFKVKEMMLGMRDEFEYSQCTSCGTIQIIAIPGNIIDYYPDYYYSFRQRIAKLRPLKQIKLLFNNFRIKKKYRKHNADIFKHLKPLKIKPSAKILDVGCGKGQLICEMYNFGFQNVVGTDKFIPEEYDYGHGVKVFKKDLSELEPNNYDLLMMHHVFEHMDKPLEELQKSYDLLKPGGYLMIRIPVVGKAWELYGANWVQLDAPRHFFIHTKKSLGILAEETGFKIKDVVYDSSSFQFYWSELYKRDIEFVDQKTKEYRTVTGVFSEEEWRTFDSMAEELNRKEEGDQAIFYLQK